MLVHGPRQAGKTTFIRYLKEKYLGNTTFATRSYTLESEPDYLSVLNAKEEWPDSGFVIIDEVDGLLVKKQDEQDKFLHRLRSWLETGQKRRLILVGGEESIEISASQQSPFNLSTSMMIHPRASAQDLP